MTTHIVDRLTSAGTVTVFRGSESECDAEVTRLRLRGVVNVVAWADPFGVTA